MINCALFCKKKQSCDLTFNEQASYGKKMFKIIIIKGAYKYNFMFQFAT